MRLLIVAVIGLLALVRVSGLIAQPLPGGTLDPLKIPKYVEPLVIPPPMPKSPSPASFAGDYYEISVRQFKQQILPTGMPSTTVWSYGSESNLAGTLNYPAFTIEAQVGKPVRVKWINGLVDEQGNFLPHLLPIDQHLHWANPEAGEGNQDSRGKTAVKYKGPVPMVVHLHGGINQQQFDGYPGAWYLPDAKNIPAGFATKGSFFDHFKNLPSNTLGSEWGGGAATYEYDNQQAATTLWFHDHTLGMTRLNVYAGPAGFYLLRGGNFDVNLGYNPPGSGADVITEIPIAIQDRSFNKNGSLFYPARRKFFDGFNGPFIPASDVPPRWNPEAFFNTMVVNGKTWPVLNVEPRRYRIRFLNGCNSRFLILKLVKDPLAARPATADLSFVQIGAEGGFLPETVTQGQLLMSPAERADVIIDFTGKNNETFYLINEGPDEPFGGGAPNADFPAADPGTTGQVIKIVVGNSITGTDTGIIPTNLPKSPFLGEVSNTRQVSLNELTSSLSFGGPIAALQGTVNSHHPFHPIGVPLMWDEHITENPAKGDVEIWEIYNFTEDAHPIHIHHVQFKVVGRKPIGGGTSVAGQNTPLPAEMGRKDTVIAYPNEITRVKALYSSAGLFVWHCHILEHEDNEMMRPYFIGDPADLPIPMKHGGK
ncbi:MAG: bilirubin oxidase [Candidatus Brocadia sp. UTAMX2]|jgi:FtsP/CotA-like multicopper oxidase with cupredoxin domain|nr:MAG: bilirubin oxidase [Candidatus Brocadia sp. UTAMX2]